MIKLMDIDEIRKAFEKIDTQDAEKQPEPPPEEDSGGSDDDKQ